MAFARKVWKLLVAIKDGLVLLFLLLFFMGLYTVLSMRPVPATVHDGALLLTLDGVVVEEPQAIGPLDLLLNGSAPTQEHRAADVIRAIDGAASDDRIKAVVLDLDYFLGAGQVHLTDIGAALDKVRKADKPVLVHAIAYTNDSMQLAAHASEVWLDPMGAALVAGPGGSYLFYGDALKRLKVGIHVYRTGQYKSAVEPYTLSRFSDAARGDIEDVYASLWENWRDEVAKARPAAKIEDVSANPSEAIAAAKGDPAQAALATGMVDMLGTREAFAAHVAELVGQDPDSPDDPGAFAHTNYQSWIAAVPPSRKGKAIGIITVAGTIVDGNAGPGTAGGDRIAQQLDDALGDDLAALVIRIDSPGGSMPASERIRQAILHYKEQGIPIVASMANMAASGGYYVATPADTIFADPATITGSIGVFMVVPTFEDALADWGVTTDSIRTTPLSGQPDLLGGLTPQMDAVFQAEADHSYEIFLGLVEKSRKMDRVKLQTLAEGRTWAGGPARQVGLIDRFGSLDDALAYAAAQAGLKDGEWHAQYLEPKPDAFSAFVQRLVSPEDDVQVPSSLAALVTARRHATMAAFASDMEMLVDAPGVQARCVACPLPPRGIEGAAKGPRWLRAAQVLFGE